jgi:hypothetical protein
MKKVPDGINLTDISRKFVSLELASKKLILDFSGVGGIISMSQSHSL